MSRDDYVEVECTIVRITANAALLRTEHGEGWCPRSVMHGASDIALRTAYPDQELTIRMREWKRDEIGL